MRILAYSAVVLLAQPVHAEVTALDDAGFVSRNEVTVPTAPAAVWQELVAINRWWSGDHTYSGDAANLYLDPQATGCFCEKLPVPEGAPFGQRMGSVEHAHIVYADPVSGVLRMSGGLGPLQGEATDATLTITLKGVEGGGTRIVWNYVVGGYMRMKIADIAPVVDRVLGEQVQRLGIRLAAEGGAPPPPGK